MRVYVEQYGYFWSLTPERWRAFCEEAARVDGYDLDDPRWKARRLARPPRGLGKIDGEWCLMTTGMEFYQPLDWSMRDFAEHLAETATR